VENDFTCPSPGDRFRSITFPLIDAVEEFNSQTEVDRRDRISDEKDLDFRTISNKSAEIDDRMHYLTVWELGGISHQSYTICEHRTCIKISATELGFVRDMVEQFSSKTLYGAE